MYKRPGSEYEKVGHPCSCPYLCLKSSLSLYTGSESPGEDYKRAFTGKTGIC